MKNSYSRLVIASVFVLSASFATAQDGSYDIIDLGTFGTGAGASANASGMNELGHVAGLSKDDNGVNHAFLYRDGQLIDLGYLPNGGLFANGKGVNDLDRVVGQANAKVPFPGTGYAGRPFVWREGDGMVDPVTENSAFGGWCWGINNSGQLALSLNQAYFWDSSTGLRLIELPSSPPGFSSTAWEINNNGVVCGAVRGGSAFLHSYRYDSATDTIEDLHDPLVYQHSEGYGINENGDIAGWAVRLDFYKFPMVWAADGRTIVLPVGDLGTFHVYGQAEHINDKGTVVGRDVSAIAELPIGWIAYDVLNAATPVKLELRTVLSAADQLSWTRMHPFEVNENGQICGTGTVNGSTRAFLMTPKVPLASATVRNGSGVNGLCFQNVSLPSLGSSWEGRVDTTQTPGALTTILVVYTQPGSGTILPTGEVLVSGISLLSQFAVPIGGVADYSLPIPNDPALAGFTLTTQAAVFDGTTWAACNAIDWVIGDLVTGN